MNDNADNDMLQEQAWNDVQDQCNQAYGMTRQFIRPTQRTDLLVGCRDLTTEALLNVLHDSISRDSIGHSVAYVGLTRRADAPSVISADTITPMVQGGRGTRDPDRV